MDTPKQDIRANMLRRVKRIHAGSTFELVESPVWSSFN